MVESGHVAVIHVVGRIADGDDDGAVFETTDVDVALKEGIYQDIRDYKPLEFRVGAGDIIDGIDETVQAMTVGETKTVRVEPAKAFGRHRSERVIEIPRANIEARSDVPANEGELVRSETGETGWITHVTDDTVTIDFNHELAGNRLEFEIRVLAADDTRQAEDETQPPNGTWGNGNTRPD